MLGRVNTSGSLSAFERMEKSFATGSPIEAIAELGTDLQRNFPLWNLAMKLIQNWQIEAQLLSGSSPVAPDGPQPLPRPYLDGKSSTRRALRP